MRCHTPYALKLNNVNELPFSILVQVDAIIYVLKIICQYERTPLHWAVEAGSVECVKELMQHADIGPALVMQDEVSYFSLHNVFESFE